IGLLAATRLSDSSPLCAAAACCVALIAAAGWYGDGDGDGVAWAVAVGGLVAGVSLGATTAGDAYRPPLLAWFEARRLEDRNAPVLLEGELREDATVTPFGVSLTLDVRRPARGGARVSIGGSAALEHVDAWRARRRIRVPALLRRPTFYGNPGLPDETRGQARRGVVLAGSVKSAALVEIVARGRAIDEAAASARAWARRQLARRIGCYSAPSGAIASAIVVGDRSGLSDEDERRLQEAGTYHVIAISGGNIAILTAILLLVVRATPIGPRASAALVIVALVFYGQVAGGGASVSRAVTAACVYLAGRMLDHRGPPLNTLAVAAAGALAASPLSAFDGGFILSFGATLGILLGAPRLWTHASVVLAFSPAAPASVVLAFRPAAPAICRIAVGLFIATVCAEIALAPASAVLFSRITVAGLLLNFAAIPLMTVTQGAAMATLAASLVSDRMALLCGYVAHLGAAGLVRSARLVDVAPWLSRDLVPPAWWLVGAYYGFCVWLLAARRHALPAAGGLACAGLLMLAAPRAATQSPVPPRGAGFLRVAFLDVGEGDAALVELPDKRTLLVDAGGLPGGALDMGERIVAPALRMFGVRRIDTLVLTHGDADHIGGAASILRRFEPHVVWEGVPVPPHPALRGLAAQADAARIAWRTVVAGDRERAGGVEVRVLHPPLPEWERQRVRNEDSIVLELRFGDVSIVLPGDIAAEGERAVAPLLSGAPITVLKAPHHGSAFSSTVPFLDAARPAAVVFSEGRGNRFGHPAPAVLQRYRERHALVFRTDQDGAIVLDTDGRHVKFSTWSGREVRINQQPSLSR
ncbi:MAG TPA: DNA internalization-related competence protein ComEC/Rec2, partial [Gemmatimonadaceae bacterium]|nr:DNA internalization-related competence protein ComEC/Rec2 [Gemmatimonadaceae bacterium]